MATPKRRPTTSRFATARPDGFGFKEGDVAGIISVRLPAKSFWDIALNVVGIWELVMIIGAFVISMLFIYYAVVAPVKRLTAATQQISMGKQANLDLASFSPSSGNELHRLAFATERLRVSINMAIQRLTGKKPSA